MNLNKTYILNPAYYLKDDVYRAIIGAFDSNDTASNEYDDSFFSIIHPFNAQLLSFFDGSNNLAKCIDSISVFFEVSSDEISSIVSQYIENKEQLMIKHNDRSIWFPRNILVEKKDNIRRETYSPLDFIIEGDINITGSRTFKPINAIFELTFKCYTDCIYCYADRSRQNEADYLTTTEIKRIIRDAKQSGIVDLDINGGEVLLHPDHREILRELVDNGFFPLISTKMPLQRNTLEYLKDIGLKRVQVSLDSINEDTLVNILKVKKSYKKDIQNTLHLLDEMDFDWQVNIILTKLNSSLEKEIKPLINYLISFNNIKRIRIGPAGCSLYKSQDHFDQIKLKYSDSVLVDEYIQQLIEENPHIPISTSSPDAELQFSSKEKTRLFPQRSICTGNQKAFVILPDGKVTVCEELYWHPKFLIGDLKKQSIMEMWTSKEATELFNLQTEIISKDSACKGCDEFSACRHNKGVCWKIILMAYGKEKWDYPDPRCPMAPKPKYPFYLA